MDNPEDGGSGLVDFFYSVGLVFLIAVFAYYSYGCYCPEGFFNDQVKQVDGVAAT